MASNAHLLVTQYANAVNATEAIEQFKIERLLYENILKLRNGGSLVNAQNDTTGYVFSGASDPKANETNFSNMYKMIVDVNALNVDDDVITKNDAKLNALLDHIESDRMWHELSVDDVLDSPTPSCRIASLDYVRLRSASLLSSDGRNAIKDLPMYEGFDTITIDDVKIPNDFYLNQHKMVPLSKYLQFRLQEELNPHYVTHPSESLLNAIIACKAASPRYFNYGIRLFHLLFERLQDDTFPYYHLPVEFRSDGKYVGSQYHTHVIMWFRYTLNQLTINLYYQRSHDFRPGHLQAQDEVVLYLMEQPFKNGKEYKKAITPINLYYGMDLKTPKDMMQGPHLHPWYNLTNADLSAKPAVFNDQTDCRGACSNDLSDRLDKACYTHNVRKYIKEGLDKLIELGLTCMHEFIDTRLKYVCYNDLIIHDVIFMRMPLGFGGYSRSHKIADVIPMLRENVAHNNAHRETEAYKRISESIIRRLHNNGRDQTRRLLNEGKYPDAHQFRASISSYMTTKSSGTAPIEMTFTVRDLTTNDVKTIKQRSTSKAGRAMCSGADSYDASSIEPRYYNVHDYYVSRSPEERARIEEEGLNATDLANMRIMSIGTRVTFAMKGIRGIYIIRSQMHVALCAVAKPHVDDTSHFNPGRKEYDIFNTPEDYGAAILTQFQDGSLDAYAPFIMSTSDRRKIIVAADCSQWDQHCQVDFIKAWFTGLKSAFLESPAARTEIYMYKDGVGITLPDICDIIMNYVSRGLYAMSYGENVQIVETNFMLSGLLVTFLLNSLINSEITYTMLPMFLEKKLQIFFLLIAGDDIAMVFGTDGMTAEDIEELRAAIVQAYTDAGHEINPNKSVISNRNVEMAKIYAHNGFVFNDPYMQPHENEKDSKDDSRLTLLRGYVHKQYDLFRRSSSRTKYTMVLLRLNAATAYHLKIVDSRIAQRLRTKRTERRTLNSMVNTKVKYYPPYAACILPSAVSGGLGCSWTGTSLNEVIFLQEIMTEVVTPCVALVDAMDFSSKEVFAMAFLNKVIPDEYKHLIPATRRAANVVVQDVKVESVSKSDADLSITAGLNFRRSMLQPSRVTLAKTAYESLKEQGIQISDSMLYSSAPYMDMIQFSDTLKRSAGANADDSFYNIYKIFDTEWNLIIPSEPISLYKFYPLYQAVSWDITFFDQAVKRYKNLSVRKPIAPDTFIECERLYRPRSGKSLRINMMGTNKALSQFTSVTGAHVTPEMIMSEMLKHNMFSDVNADDRITALLTSISGNPDAATKTVQELNAVTHTWADMMMASSINATVLETLDIRPGNLDALIMCRIPGFPKVLLRVFRIIGFHYMLCCASYYNREPMAMEFKSNAKTDAIIGRTKTARKQVSSTAEPYNLHVHDTYVKLNEIIKYQERIYADENHA
nr:RNA-dependent RNA polymerase [Clear Lake virus]